MNLAIAEGWKCVLHFGGDIDTATWASLRRACTTLKRVCDKELENAQRNTFIYLLIWKSWSYGHCERHFFALQEVPETIDTELVLTGHDSVRKTKEVYAIIKVTKGSQPKASVVAHTLAPS